MAGMRIETHDGLAVEWVALGEGYSGDYDPSNPDDVELLRFDVEVREAGEWVPFDDGSYCTLMPADAPEPILAAGLNLILTMFRMDPSKRTLERLSWIDPTWV